MKKLLLILLCLPMIGFGQVTTIEYYLPDGAAGLTSNIVAAKYISLVNHVYTDLPDSIYGNTYTVNPNGQSTFASGHYYYFPSTILASESTLNGWPYFQFFGSATLNNNMPFIWDWYSIIDSAINDGVDTFFYDTNNNMIKSVMHSTFSWNTAPPQIITEQHNIDQYIFNANNKIIQIDFNHYLTIQGSVPTLSTETNNLFYDGAGRLIKVELPFNTELRYAYIIYGVSKVDLYQNNNFIDEVSTCTYDANGIISEFINKEYFIDPLTHIVTYAENSRYQINHDANGRYVYRSHELWDPVTSNWNMQNEWYYLYNNQTTINEITSLDRSILKITDALGRNATPILNTPLFYIYDDGTVEKRIVIE